MEANLTQVYDQIVARNPGEAEFHQSVREVFEISGFLKIIDVELLE